MVSVEYLKRVRALFESGSAENGSARQALLDRECANDQELRDLVDSMFSAEIQEHPILDHPLCLPLAHPENDLWSFKPGARVGAYRILGEIASGGMGAVYLAELADGAPSGRYALKIVRWPSPDFSRRFEQEHRILRSLDHPNIARFVDNGATEDKSAYFVMEFVDGQAIHEYSRRANRSTEEKVSLFRNVCCAVSYLHRNLVIHRDLKPGNILITPEGTVKLVDFGIAKILEPQAALDETAEGNTAFGLMTPDYASPEQVCGRARSTLTDVYSLGVVLYELLTGVKPFASGPGAAHDQLRRICEDEPDRPSIAAGSRKLRGELDNIILKAMRKVPEERYRTVDELDEDLRRFLNGLPVTAQGDSLTYRARKFVSRHKAGVTAAGVMVSLLAAGIVATSIEAGVARTERARAETQAARADAARITAEHQTRLADEERSRAEHETALARLERENADRRLRQLEVLANSAAKIYTSAAGRVSSPETAALLAKHAHASIQSLGGEENLPPGLAQVSAATQAEAHLHQLALDAAWQVPSEWSAGQTQPGQYQVAMDSLFVHGGKRSLLLRSIVRSPVGAVDVHQEFDASHFAGKRVRLSAFLASTRMVGSAMLWLSASKSDEPTTGGNTHVYEPGPWKRYQVVLDVPQGSEDIQFGLVLRGDGVVWADDYHLDVVSNLVPLTARRRPENLDFRK